MLLKLLCYSWLLSLGAFASRSWVSLSLLSAPLEDSNCKDGVCAVPTSNATENTVSSKLGELVKMGWDEKAANKTLTEVGYDVEKAALKLDDEARELEEVEALVKDLTKVGNWSPEAAESAILQAKKNITEATLMLEQEERIINENFNAAVKDMIANGWDEVVARQALLTQWTLDQRKALGMNVTVPADVLASIKPTLKKQNETASASVKKNTPKSAASAGQAAPKEAAKEDCVFEGTAQDFQRLVMDSDKPVLVDVYADWCGPCKQLGPILETAAMRSGGMFLLVKINSDKQREIAETLGVTGLPSVFAISKGRVTDRFVGMLPQDQLQTFLVRLLTGYGERVQADQLSETQLDDMTRKLAKIKSLVDEVLNCSDALKADGSPEEGLLTAIRVIKNAHNDIRNSTFRSLSKSSQAFLTKIQPSVAATTLLDVAGFKDAVNGSALTLVHTNPAILSVILQRLGDSIQRRKMEKNLKATEHNPPPSKKMKYALKNKVPETISSAQKIHTEQQVKETPAAPAKKKTAAKALDGKVSVVVRVSDREEAFQGSFPQTASLLEMMEGLLQDAGVSWESFEIRYPNPRRLVTRESAELKQTLQAVCGVRTDELFKKPSLNIYIDASKPEKKSRGVGALFGKKKKAEKKGTHTLLSSGILKNKKHNEFFGGDSTVTVGGDEEEEQ